MSLRNNHQQTSDGGAFSAFITWLKRWKTNTIYEPILPLSEQEYIGFFA